jgi:hypothetical protein
MTKPDNCRHVRLGGGGREALMAGSAVCRSTKRIDCFQAKARRDVSHVLVVSDQGNA